MNKELEDFARENIKENLKKCTEKQVQFFKRIHSHEDQEKPINDIVDSMSSDRLEGAMDLIERTISNNKRG